MQVEILFDSINCFQIVNFGSVQNFSVHIIGDFTSPLSVLASNYAFVIKFVEKWPGRILDVVVGTLKVSLDHLFTTTNCSAK